MARNSQYADLPADLRAGITAAQDAQNAPYGSIAQRDDPSQYGSVLRRKYPGVFSPRVTTQEEDDDAQIKRNARVLTLRQQNMLLQNPYASNIYANKQQLTLRRQQQQLDPSYPDLGLDDDAFDE